MQFNFAALKNAENIIFVFLKNFPFTSWYYAEDYVTLILSVSYINVLRILFAFALCKSKWYK